MSDSQEMGLGQSLRDVLKRTPKRGGERSPQAGVSEVDVGLIRPQPPTPASALMKHPGGTCILHQAAWSITADCGDAPRRWLRGGGR